MEAKDVNRAETQRRYYEANKERIRQQQKEYYVRKVGHEPYQGTKPGRKPGVTYGSYKQKWIEEGIKKAMESISNENTQ